MSLGVIAVKPKFCTGNKPPLKDVRELEKLVMTRSGTRVADQLVQFTAIYNRSRWPDSFGLLLIHRIVDECIDRVGRQRVSLGSTSTRADRLSRSIFGHVTPLIRYSI